MKPTATIIPPLEPIRATLAVLGFVAVSVFVGSLIATDFGTAFASLLIAVLSYGWWRERWNASVARIAETQSRDPS